MLTHEAPLAVTPITDVAPAAVEQLPRRELCTVAVGVIALEPKECGMQMAPFANWAQSRLSYQRVPVEDVTAHVHRIRYEYIR